MSKKIEVLIVGILTSFVLGFFLKILELITDLNVYTLLLNIDFIPILGNINFPECMEICFHIIISVILTYIFYYFVVNNNSGEQNVLLYVSLINLLIGFLVFTITVLFVNSVQ